MSSPATHSPPVLTGNRDSATASLWPKSPRLPFTHRALQSLPALLVLAALFGVLAWGQLHHWRIPKFSAWIGEPTSAVDDWCAEHSVPESVCVVCDEAAQKSKGYGWCRVHGITECPYEHPDVPQLEKPLAVAPDRIEQIDAALRLRPRPANNSRCKTHERQIQVATPETLTKLGVSTEPAALVSVVETIEVTGEVTFNQNHTAHLSSRVPGVIWQVQRQIGEAVKPGDVLLLVDAGEVGTAKSEFLKSLGETGLKRRVHDRLAALAGKGSIPGRQVQEAEAAVQESEIRLLAAREALVNLGLPIALETFEKLTIDEASRQLRFLGIPEELIPALQAQSASSSLIPVRSPIEGVLVEHHAVVGEVVDTTTRLCTVADRSQLWVTVDVPQHEARFVKPGQKLLFHSDGGEADFTGSIDWIADSIDPDTRMLKVRAEVRNDARQVKARSFGAGRIVLREDPQAVVVPNEAVHSEGCCTIVFVRHRDFLKPDSLRLFEIRKVRTGVRTATHTELIAGMLPGEVIATQGSEALRVELLKGNLGDGCGCAH